MPPQSNAVFSWSDELTPSRYWLELSNSCIYNGQYYELPYSVEVHARYFYSLLYVRSALQTKAHIIGSCFRPHRWLSQQHFNALVLDYLWFGNAYLERCHNRLGQILQLRPAPAKFTRRTLNNRYVFLGQDPLAPELHHFAPGSICHLLEPDVNQELYGVPEWLPTIESALLNEASTKFRLRYYRNGSHAGYIMYLTDANFTDGDIEALQEQLNQSKGDGNFKNLLLYAPNGKTDGIKLIPISEVAAKDEFFNIKSVSRDDQLAACRVPPHMMGIIPTNSSGFGSVSDAAKVFARNELQPLQDNFAQINAWLGEEVVRFEPYHIDAGE